MHDHHAIANRVAAVFIAKRTIGHDYCAELACEALLELRSTGMEGHFLAHVRWFAERTGIVTGRAARWENQQFHNLGQPLFMAEGRMEQHLEPYVAESKRWIEEGPRSASGALAHHCLHAPAGTLIDMVQAYLLRLARVSALTGDESWVNAGLEEMERYRGELEDPSSGCWHQGKGWLPGDAVSPGCWSRGQGWLLRGLSAALPLTRKNTRARFRLETLLRDLLLALLPLQREDGLWNQLVDDPENDIPDSSGSALIYAALEAALAEGLLDEALHRDAAERAWRGLAACVQPSGLVTNVSMGPGPIWQVETWRRMPGLTGDPHGMFTMLFACAARARARTASEP